MIVEVLVCACRHSSGTLAMRACILGLFSMLPILLAAPAEAACPAGSSTRLEEMPMVLGAQTHFSQGWPLSTLDGATDIGARSLRDSLPWHRVEEQPGRYGFEHKRVSYVKVLGDAGFVTSLVFNWGNPIYDGGYTPYTDRGRAGMAAFAVSVLKHFPTVSSVEIGNEFNGQNFVSGPVKHSSYGERDDYYVHLLEAVSTAIKAVRPDITVLGGATHSIPVAYLRRVFENGALCAMDGVSIHPYTTDPEQFKRQLELLESAMGANLRPIHVTEFGVADRSYREAAAYLVKYVGVLAANDVASANWYALRQQENSGAVALLDKEGKPTQAGRAFAFVQEQLLARGMPTDISPDRFTYAFRYGDDALVIWGEPRGVQTSADVTAYGVTGRQLTEIPDSIDPKVPLVLIGDEPIDLGRGVDLEATDLVGDSYHEFGYPSGDEGRRTDGQWSYHARKEDGTLVALQTMEGGEIAGSIWTPYVGSPYLRPLFITAEAVNPLSTASGRRRDIVEQFRVPRDGLFRVRGSWKIRDKRNSVVIVSVSLNGEELRQARVTDRLQLDLAGIAAKHGDLLTFAVTANEAKHGSTVTRRRIQIFSDGFF